MGTLPCPMPTVDVLSGDRGPNEQSRTSVRTLLREGGHASLAKGYQRRESPGIGLGMALGRSVGGDLMRARHIEPVREYGRARRRLPSALRLPLRAVMAHVQRGGEDKVPTRTAALRSVLLCTDRSAATWASAVGFGGFPHRTPMH
jgi:hypothetical protein